MRRVKSGKQADLASLFFWLSARNGNSEHLRRNNSFADFRYAARHANRKVVAYLDGDDAAGHVDGNRAVAQTKLVCHSRRRAAAAAARQGVACAALPNFDLDVRAVEDFHELHVCSVW